MRKKQPTRMLMIWLGIIISAWLPQAQEATPTPATDMPEAAIIVNGRSIPKNHVEMEARLMGYRMEQSGAQIPGKNPMILYRKESASNLIKIELILELAGQAGLSVPPESVDLAFNQVQQKLGSPEKLDQLCQELDVTKDFLHKQVQDNLLVNMYIKKVADGLSPVQEEGARQYYDEHPDEFENPEEIRASHILLTVAADAGEEEWENARQKAESILQRLQTGEEFAAVAKAESDCQSASQGGDLGFFGKGRMIPAFEQAAFALEVGAISPVVKTDFGYHIIKVTDKKAGGKMNFDEIKNQLIQYLNQSQIRLEMERIFEEAKAKATIEYVDESLTPVQVHTVDPFANQQKKEKEPETE
ncbi:MAG: peptidylprolyl isomerase [Acidobacteria bacterium]|nr:peptidylprolyl isomerase [Acidobacteriota bacterium]